MNANAHRFNQLMSEGDAAFGHKDFARAATLYGEAMQLRPDVAGVGVNLGRALCLQGQFEAALAHYRGMRGKCAQEDVNEILFGHAFSAERTGQFQEAEATIRDAIRLLERDGDPLIADAYYVLGKAELGLGRYVEAANWFEKTVKVRPEHRQAIKMLFYALSRAGRWLDIPRAYLRIVRGGADRTAVR